MPSSEENDDLRIDENELEIPIAAMSQEEIIRAIRNLLGKRVH